MIRFFEISILALAVCLCRANIKPFSDFNPEEDAKFLDATINLTNTAEENITDILTHRTRTQRLLIKDAYWRVYNRSLVDELDNVISGDYKSLIFDLLMPLPEYYARALVAAKTKSEIVADVLLNLKAEELREVNTRYKKLNLAHEKISLPDFLARQEQFFTPKMIRKAFAEVRSTSENEKEVPLDVVILHTGFPKQIEYLLSKRSFKQLLETFKSYESQYGAIENLINGRDFSETLNSAINHCIAYTKDPQQYVAMNLYRALTVADNDMLIHFAVSRSESDLTQIAEQFELLYGQSLSSYIFEHTAGSFRNALLEIVEQ